MRRWENCPRCRVTVERVEGADGSPAHVDVLGGRHKCRLSDVIDAMMKLPGFLRELERASAARPGLVEKLLKVSMGNGHHLFYVPRMAGKTYATAVAVQIARERQRIEFSALTSIPVVDVDEVERRVREEFNLSAGVLRLQLAQGTPRALCEAVKRHAARVRYEREAEAYAGTE